MLVAGEEVQRKDEEVVSKKQVSTKKEITISFWRREAKEGEGYYM